MPQSLIRRYEIRVASPECYPGSDRLRAFVSLENDISEVLPYLNAELVGFDYHHQDKILLWANNGKIYAFRPHEIAIAPVIDNEEARELAKSIIHTVNNIWQRRDKIKPNFGGRKRPPNVLDIYKLLPSTNCKECGFLTCMAFAAALRNDPTKSSLCPYLSEQEYLKLLDNADKRT
jgi:ArsR family metal-binding transcriptional regulator